MLLRKDSSMFDPGELSSIGTSRLLGQWERAFMPHGLVIATGWLTHSIWQHPNQRENLRRSGGKLSGFYTVPVVNENDLISRSELKKMKRGEGDNDYLGRRVALLLKADGYLILTESGGIYNHPNPGHSHARRYVELDGRTTFRLGVKNGGTSKNGTGGPQSKINQASFCFRRGMRAAIAGMDEEKAITRFTHGELVGTTITNRTILAK
jgi:glutamate 5-kinase